MNELPTPPDAADDAEAVEVLRAWIVRETLQCSIQTDVFPDPGTWGVVLAEVIRYVASARQEQEGVPETETVQHILAAFDAEMRPSEPQSSEPRPTSEPRPSGSGSEIENAP